MITNEQGQVAIKYYQTIPHILRTGGKEYAFVVRARLCMAWIDASQVDKVLQIKKNCCGNNSKTVYSYANEQTINIWTNGGGSGR